MSARTEQAELTVMVMVKKKGTDLVAVQERRKGNWDGLIFPGGHVERGESFAVPPCAKSGKRRDLT